MDIFVDHHLLFGLLALQVGLIDQAQLAGAFHAWSRDKERPLADHLAGRGDLDAADVAAIGVMARRLVERQGGDVGRSLASLGVERSTLEQLESVADSELTKTLAQLDETTDPGDPITSRPTRVDGGSSTAENRRYRILRPHAQGGLGAVYLALDVELNREVALKQVLERHADDPTCRQRFLVEAEITGGLEHPGIVPVYGLGADQDGRPFYAMRFIRGDSLKEALASFHDDAPPKADAGRRPLGLRDLLRRFTDVCNAIEYAHSRGVLHRDIKPGNVIVGKHGETLVVDWGLAKARGHREEAVTTDEATLVISSASGSAETLPGRALGTPAYMSLEQARGDVQSLGPRSDVYSLGATLFCLLTGRAPFEGGDLGLMLWAVQQGAFPPPRRLGPAIDRPLEAICLKAMATDPEARYASARDLADDVERWLADEPTVAWPEPWSRSMTRWLGRHRTGVTAAAVAGLVALAGLVVVAAVQTQGRLAMVAKNAELRAANERVEQRYELAAEAIRTFHTGVSEDFLLRETQFKDLRDRLLRSALGFNERLGRLLDRETDPGSRQALSRANFELAELTEKVGRQEDALSAHRAVLAARKSLESSAGADLGAKIDVARSLTEIGRLLSSTGRADEALESYRKAEALLTVPARIDPSALAALAACRTLLGDLLASTGKAVEALAAYRRAKSDQEKPAALPGAPMITLSELASTRHRLSILLVDRGRWDEAEAEQRAALAIRHRLAESDPTVPGLLSRLADSHSGLGLLMSKTGRPAEAEAELRAALAARRRLVDAYPAVADFGRLLASSHDNLGVQLARRGRSEEAEAEYRAALAILRPLSEFHPAVTNYRSYLASVYNNLGVLLAESGRLNAAEPEYRAALATYRSLADANPSVADFRSRLAGTHNNLGNLLVDLGRMEAAEAEYRASLAIRRGLVESYPNVPDFRSRLANAHNNLGILLYEKSRLAEAETEYRAARTLLLPLVEANPAIVEARLRLGNSHFGLAELLSKTGRPAEAESEYLKALSIRQALVEAHPADVKYRRGLAESLSRIAVLQLVKGDLAGAADSLRKALAILDQAPTRLKIDLYAVARFRALLAVATGDAIARTDPGRTEADRAMEALREAVAAGYRDLEHLREDRDLDSLRSRDDFRLMMVDLTFPDDPFRRDR